MARMVRKQVYITPEQDRLLKRQAKALGKSEADVVRQGIELASGSKASPPFNPGAWRKEMRFIRKRMRMRMPQAGRTWTREELYNERFERHSR